MSTLFLKATEMAEVSQKEARESEVISLLAIWMEDIRRMAERGQRLVDIPLDGEDKVTRAARARLVALGYRVGDFESTYSSSRYLRVSW